MEEETEEVTESDNGEEEELTADDLNLFPDLVNLTALDNDTTEEADNATADNITLFSDYDDGRNSNGSDKSLFVAIASEDGDDFLYRPLFVSILADNVSSAAADNDTELFDDFLVDASDDNDTAAVDVANRTTWEDDEEDDSLFSTVEAEAVDEDEAVVPLDPSSELEANVGPPLGTACVFM